MGKIWRFANGNFEFVGEREGDDQVIIPVASPGSTLSSDALASMTKTPGIPRFYCMLGCISTAFISTAWCVNVDGDTIVARHLYASTAGISTAVIVTIDGTPTFSSTAIASSDPAATGRLYYLTTGAVMRSVT